MSTRLERQIEYVPIALLRPWDRNARTHSRKQIQQIAESIQTFGFTNPVLIDAKSAILAGHGRVEAARLLSMDEIPCVRLESMTPAQKRAYVLADNKLALNTGWDEDILGEELSALLEMDLDFDIGVTGFSIPEVDNLIEALEVEEPDDPKDDVLPGDGERVCQVGDIWRLGAHRLICGDALDPVVITLGAGLDS
jgi:ParB-like chromosome segregation protein Spo0J